MFLLCAECSVGYFPLSNPLALGRNDQALFYGNLTAAINFIARCLTP